MTAHEVYGRIFKGADTYTTDAGPWIKASAYYALEAERDKLHTALSPTEEEISAMADGEYGEGWRDCVKWLRERAGFVPSGGEKHGT